MTLYKGIHVLVAILKLQIHYKLCNETVLWDVRSLKMFWYSQ
jgi:hypothetical protein